jgi:7-keto-8-aminopelargonate synthetase-like enzyme/predicted N-acyltransferase
MNNFLNTVNDVITDGKNSGILHLTTSDQVLHGNMLSINNKELVNFSSCSYLGLEFDNRLIEGNIQAVRNYGTQFSASRAYVSSIHYQELESKFNAIFDAHCVVAPTTTLGHIAAIPVLVSENDAVILDHQVHNSVQTAASLLKPKGIHVELIRHNRLDLLEARVAELSKKYHKVWYMADGIYSMYGDGAPVNAIYNLLNKYERFHFYVDDAHGMSCFGKHGRGYVLENQILHPKMVLAISLAKAFATGGAVLVFPTEKLANFVRTCGGPMITSGPMQPGALGAALASADIHLSSEITDMQRQLHENIKYANLMIHKAQLPLIKDLDSPVFFVGVGLPKVGYNLIRNMMNDGYYTNLGAFPAVPMKNTGVRFTITRLHTFKQIEGMVESMNYHFDKVLKEQNFSRELIYKSFKMESPVVKKQKSSLTDYFLLSQLKVEKYKSIKQIDAKEWNDLFEGKGSFDVDGLNFLETVFENSNTKKLENAWDFDYLIVREKRNNKIVLATFFTTTLCKDDMLAHEAVSEKIESIRTNDDPYFLTSKMVMTGSLLTEGQHIYIDDNSEYKKQAFHQLYEMASLLQKQYNASSIMLRDFQNGQSSLDKLMLENGFFKVQMPDNNHQTINNWKNEDEYLNTLSKKERYHVRHEILKYQDRFIVEIINHASENSIEKWLNLYQSVKKDSYKLNTFDLPKNLFENISSSKNWEVLSLKLTTVNGLEEVAVVFNYKSGNVYNAMFIGINKNIDVPFSIYRQSLYQILKRAKELNCVSVNYGFTASLEKRRVGAVAVPTVAYMQSEDHFNASVIDSMQVVKNQSVMA